jgi:hypothetical protein
MQMVCDFLPSAKRPRLFAFFPPFERGIVARKVRTGILRSSLRRKQPLKHLIHRFDRGEKLELHALKSSAAPFCLASLSATLAARVQQAPTAAEIDKLPIEFLELEEKVGQAYKIAVAADEPHERMREELICLAEEFGSTHAEKSKLLHGIQYEIMATFGMSTSIDAAAA